MADKFPTFNPSEQGSIADLRYIWEQRALTWSSYKGKFDRHLGDSAGYVNVDGHQCYGGKFTFSYHDLRVPWDNKHPHVEYLRMLGMTDNEIYQLWLDGIDPPEIVALHHTWKNPDVGRTIDMANLYYAEILEALTNVTTITLQGENILYNASVAPNQRKEVTSSILNGHSSSAVHINQTDYDLYEDWVDVYLVDSQIANTQWLDKLLAVKLYDNIGTDITPNDKPLLDAIMALILLEGDSFAVHSLTEKISERFQAGDGGFIPDRYYVTSKMTYDISTPTQFLDMNDFIHTSTEYYDKEELDEYGYGEILIQEIWKNYFWKYREPDSDEGDLWKQSKGILLLKNGVIYLTVAGLKTATEDDFKNIIAPAINIYSEVDNGSFLKQFLSGIATFLNELYGGIYNLLKNIPYFKLKEEHLVDYLVKYGDPFHNREFTKEEAEAYMEGVGTKAIGLTIGIILTVLSAGFFAGASATALTITEGALAVGITGAGLTAVYIVSYLSVIAVQIGLQAYTSYMDAEQAYDNEQLDKQFAELEELEEQASDEAEEAVNSATTGTMGDVDEFELQNYIMYTGIYNEKFETQLEHIAPFDRGGEFEPKYKQGG